MQKTQMFQDQKFQKQERQIQQMKLKSISTSKLLLKKQQYSGDEKMALFETALSEYTKKTKSLTQQRDGLTIKLNKITQQRDQYKNKNDQASNKYQKLVQTQKQIQKQNNTLQQKLKKSKKIKIFMGSLILILSIIIGIFIVDSQLELQYWTFQSESKQDYSHDENIQNLTATTIGQLQNTYSQIIQSKQKQIIKLKEFIKQDMINPLIIEAEDMDRYQKGRLEKLYQAIRIIKFIEEQDSKLYVQVFQKIGQFFLHHSEYQLYIDFLKALKEILEQKNQTQTLKYIQILNQMGYGYMMLEQYDTALQNFDESLKRRKFSGDQSSLNRAALLNNIGLCYHKKGQYYKAWTQLSQALKQIMKLKNKASLSINQQTEIDKLIKKIKTQMQEAENNSNKK